MRRQSTVTRRRFVASAIGAAALGRTGTAASQAQVSAAAPAVRPATAAPALLGGTPIRRAPFPAWTIADAVLKVRAHAAQLTKS